MVAGGAVYTWGQGSSGELGVTPDKEFVVPFPMKVPGLSNIVQVECGDLFTLALGANGIVYSFGSSAKGRLGRTTGDTLPIGPVEGLQGIVVHQIAAGQAHSLCIGTPSSDTADGVKQLFGWGSPHAAALGAGSISGAIAARIPGLPEGISVVSCSAGFQNSACVLEDGTAWIWGSNSHGKSGAPPKTPFIGSPTQLFFGDARIRTIDLGSVFSAAISADETGTLFTWGYGLSGCLGHGARVASIHSPTAVEALRGIPVRQVSCTRGQINPDTTGKVNGKEQPHAMCVTNDGRLYTWGTCHKGMLGNHSKKILSPPVGDELVPYLVGSPTRDVPGVSGYLQGEVCTQAIASSIHSAVVTQVGNVFCFGCGSGGRTGLRRYMEGLHGGRSRMKCYISVPSPIEYFKENNLKVTHLSTSRRHMAAVVSQ